LEPDTTTPLFPLEAAGVRADFLPEEKKKKKEDASKIRFVKESLGLESEGNGHRYFG
jgi:hypothetical protein